MIFTTALCFAGLALLASAGRADCPMNKVEAGDQTISGTSPTGSVTFEDGGYFGLRRASASYDIPNATLAASASSNSDFNCLGRATINDDFVVVGALPGIPVHVVANLTVSGSSGGYGAIVDTHGNGVETWGPLPNTIVLPEDLIAGQPARLTFIVSAQKSHGGATASGRFSFVGLPVGSAIVSCNGYNSDPAVTASGTSWGRLKRIYR